MDARRGAGRGAWGMGHGAWGMGRTQRLMYVQGTSAPAWYRLEGESLMPRVYLVRVRVRVRVKVRVRVRVRVSVSVRVRVRVRELGAEGAHEGDAVGEEYEEREGGAA